VVADFHQRSLHEPIKPLLLGSEKNNIYSMHVAFRPQTPGGSEWKNGISKIEKLWKEQFPNDEFDYEFLDATIAKFYQGEQHISSLLKWSTGLAIFISCLGLLGLVMYTTHLRTKEIGVRKVLGASVTQIFSLISRDFLKLVIIAFVIATPFAYWALHNWLNNFAYRTSMNWWVFAVSGAGMLVLALLILGFQIIRAATVNPVKSLRTE
jgi:ABC-type antimicrobial peptide transport system permease subunit